jgi:hypothetical protein
MSTVDLSNYYSAGYFLIRANDPRWELPKELFPDQLISLSRCICPRLELPWGWEKASEQALDFGISADQFESFVAWCEHEHTSDADWGMFYSPEAVRRFIKHFMANTQNLHIIGVGFPREIAEIGWRGNIRDEKDYGIRKRIQQHLPLESRGEVLGHELVGFEYGDFGHSWICNHIYEEPLGFRLNERGFISDYDGAKKVYDWIAEDDMKGMRGEPEPYYIWLLVSYPLSMEEGENHE